MEYRSIKSHEKCHDTSDSSDFSSYHNNRENEAGNEAGNESEYIVRSIVKGMNHIYTLKIFKAIA